MANMGNMGNGKHGKWVGYTFEDKPGAGLGESHTTSYLMNVMALLGRVSKVIAINQPYNCDQESKLREVTSL